MKVTRAQLRALEEAGFEVSGKHHKAEPAKRKWNGDARRGHSKPHNHEEGNPLFLAACKAHGLPKPIAEYPFHPTRKWLADYVFEGWLLVEIDGGGWTQGRHVRGKGFEDDMEKQREAVILGYAVIHFTPQEVESGEAFTIIKRALDAYAEVP